jgi:hypothetical protein
MSRRRRPGGSCPSPIPWWPLPVGRLLPDGLHEQQPAFQRRAPQRQRLGVFGRGVPPPQLLHRRELDDHHPRRVGPLPFRNLGIGGANEVPAAIPDDGPGGEIAVAPAPSRRRCGSLPLSPPGPAGPLGPGVAVGRWRGGRDDRQGRPAGTPVRRAGVAAQAPSCPPRAAGGRSGSTRPRASPQAHRTTRVLLDGLPDDRRRARPSTLPHPEYLPRLDALERALLASGQWTFPHPWLGPGPRPHPRIRGLRLSGPRGPGHGGSPRRGCRERGAGSVSGTRSATRAG